MGKVSSFGSRHSIAKALLGLLMVTSATSLSACLENTPPKVAAPEAARTVDFLPSDLYSIPAPVVQLHSGQAGQQGTVLIRTLVDTAGQPSHVTVEKSSGNQVFDQAALDSVRGARFRPRTEDGKAQAVWMLIPIRIAKAGS